jgi:hypothetical protein
MRPTPLLFVTLFLAAGALTQQEPARADKPAAPKAPFVFEAGTVELRALVERCGAYLQRNILLDDGELFPSRGQRQGGANAEAAPAVELQLPIVTDRDGCEEVLAHLLWSRNLALTPLDEAKGLWEVLSMHGPRAREIVTRAVHRTPEQVLARPALRQFVSVVYTLEHTNAMQATNSLRPFFAQFGQGQSNQPQVVLGNVGNATAMLLTGPQDLVAAALRTLQQADVPQPEGPRAELEQRVEQLAQQLAGLQQRLAALEQKPAKGG